MYSKGIMYLMPFRAPTSFHDTSGTKKIQIKLYYYYYYYLLKISVADSGCFSRIRDQQQHQNLNRTIFCSHKYYKIVNNFIFEQVKEILFSQNTKNYSTRRIASRIKNIILGSGIRKKTYPGSQIQGQKGTGSRIRIRDTVKKMSVPVAKPSRLALGCTSFNATLQSSCMRKKLFVWQNIC